MNEELLRVLHETWCKNQKLGLGSAEDLMAGSVSPAQYDWLCAFCDLWEAALQLDREAA